MSKQLSPQQLAEMWVAKHQDVIIGDGGSSAMDRAVKIIALETATEKGRADLFRAAAPFGASFLDSIPGQPHPATDFLSARDIVAAAGAAKVAAAAATGAPSPTGASASAAGLAPAGTVSSALAECPYCKEPASRFCKESGRRHETPEEKANRRWKHIFRQMAMMSSFVSNVRMKKKNTCIENGAVELSFN